MVDTSAIDLVALIEQHASIRFGPAVGRNENRTRKGGPCPFCGLGNDRFAIFINEVPQRYYCGIHGSGCGAHGDAITFVREYLQIESHYEACEFLEVDPGSEYAGPRRRNVHNDEEPPCKKWMERAEVFCMESKTRLWSEEGKRALDWLCARGLTDSTIQRAGLGLNLAQGYQSAKEWGVDEKVWVSRGIVIPWSVGGAIWKVNIRRSDKDIAAENARLRTQGKKENAAKYRQIAGGTNGLYCVDLIQPGQPLVLVEGEFDCLALLQATEKRFAVVATGSTANGRGERWREAIKQATPVLIAFDDDENRAGDNAASVWKECVPQSIRWLPWRHDVNDMLLQNMNLPQWVELGIDVAIACHTPVICHEEQQGKQEIDESTLAQLSDEPALCGTCLDMGIMRSALPNDYEGNMYCEEHHPAHQMLSPSEQEQPAETPVVSNEERYQRFLQIAQCLADAIPGSCAVHIDPPSYTIQDRARSLEAKELESYRAGADGDYWHMIRSNIERPPVDDHNRPYYTKEAWRAKLEELQNWRPDEHLYRHFPGGYEGYCKLHRGGTLESGPRSDERQAA